MYLKLSQGCSQFITQLDLQVLGLEPVRRTTSHFHVSTVLQKLQENEL